MESKSLLDGHRIPTLGLGTYQLRGKTGRKAIVHAINTGYRHLDTASFYNNEDIVGQAVSSCRIDREEIFVTTKVWTSDLGYERTKKALSQSLDQLGMEYVDLYLIHWPGNNSERRLSSWKAMEELKDENLVKSIGVSNFDPSQIKAIISMYDQVPVVNQIRFSPFSYDRTTLEYCEQMSIAVTAYSPLNKGQGLKQGLLDKLAKKYGKTGAQIALRWAVQKGTIVIPKSKNPKRIEENVDIFDFSIDEEDMQRLDGLS